MKIQKGFTLIELVVVIAIIGVLVGGIAPFMLDKIKDARDARRIIDLNNIQVELSTYMSANAKYPDTAADVKTIMGKQIIKDPRSGTNACGGSVNCDYTYTQCDNGNGYLLGSRFETPSYQFKYKNDENNGDADKKGSSDNYYEIGECVDVSSVTLTKI